MSRILSRCLIALCVGFSAPALAQSADHRDFHDWSTTLRAPAPRPKSSGDYHFVADLFPALAQLIADRPDLIQPERIGDSIDGRPIWAFHIQGYRAPIQRKILLFGGIHAMEWIGTEVAIQSLIDFARHPTPGVRLTVIPLLNPDGRAKVEQDLIAGRDTWRRGNRRNIDLNRDFAVNRDRDPVWAHLPFSRRFYHTTPGPLSQPESRALDALAERERFDRAISFHAFGGFLFYPWAGAFERPADRVDFMLLVQAMERAQRGQTYRGKQLGRNLFFFRAGGSEIDHLYGRYQTRAILVELSRSGATWSHPGHFWPYFRRYNPENREKHIEMGVQAAMGLIHHPRLPSGH